MKKIFCKAFSCFVLVSSFAAIPALALDNGLAKTPPMGWNSWNKFACDVSEELIRSIADAMVTSGLKDAGYEYVVIDDCWQVARDHQGNIIPDPKRFPHGMKAVIPAIVAIRPKHIRGLHQNRHFGGHWRSPLEPAKVSLYRTLEAQQRMREQQGHSPIQPNVH